MIEFYCIIFLLSVLSLAVFITTYNVFVIVEERLKILERRCQQQPLRQRCQSRSRCNTTPPPSYEWVELQVSFNAFPYFMKFLIYLGFELWPSRNLLYFFSLKQVA